MSLTGPKENANPTVHAVLDGDTRRRERHLTSIGRGEIERFNFRAEDGRDGDCERRLRPDDNDAENCWSSSSAPLPGGEVSWGLTGRSPVERSVHLALMHAASASGGRDVEVLREAGFVIPAFPDDSTAGKGGGNGGTEPEMREATFVPAVAHPPSPGGGADADDRMRSGADSAAGAARGRDAIDAEEVFETIRNVQDPEHPLTLEQLGVVRPDHVSVVDLEAGGDDGGEEGGDGRRRPALSKVDVRFTPTIPHCSMATLIGLCLRVKLLRSLPSRFKVTVRIEPGTHASEDAVNRQLDDKERVRAALENEHLRGVVDKCIRNGMAMSSSAAAGGGQ